MYSLKSMSSDFSRLIIVPLSRLRSLNVGIKRAPFLDFTNLIGKFIYLLNQKRRNSNKLFVLRG
jgi:hypothetical protein